MNGLLDFLSDKDEQRKMLSALASTLNRGMVANTLGAPVDTVAMMLRPFGYNNPAPVGGSEWFGGLLEKGGFVDRERRPVAETLAGLLTPAATQAAAKVGAALENAAAVAARNAQTPRRLNPQAGVIVFHGSPYKFDKFDSSKIGTGEGFQAYGHGLYFSDTPDVAEHYRRYTSRTLLGKDDFKIKKNQFEGNGIRVSLAQGEDDLGNPIGTVVMKVEDLKSGDVDWAHYGLEEVNSGALSDAIKRLTGKNAANVVKHTRHGFTYKVDLPDDMAGKMLDWDKPIREQGEIRKGLLGIDSQIGDAVTGGDAYQLIAQKLGDIEAAQALRRLGIPGVRYLDGNSRAAGQGAHNYVVFPGEEGLLSILGRE